MMIEETPNRFGMFEVLIVGCSDVMTGCSRTGCGDQAP